MEQDAIANNANGDIIKKKKKKTQKAVEKSVNSQKDAHEKGTMTSARAHCRRSVGHGLDRTKCHQCGAAAYGTSAVVDNLFSAIVHTTNVVPSAPRATTGERTRARAHTHTHTHNLADVRRATRPWPSVGGGKSVYVLRTRTRAGERTTTAAAAVGGGLGGRTPVVDGRNIADGRHRGKPETSTATTGPPPIALAFFSRCRRTSDK